MVNKQTNLVLRSSLMIHMKALESKHHLAELKTMLMRELKVWSSGLYLEGNIIKHIRRCHRRFLRIYNYSHSHLIKGDSKLKKSYSFSRDDLLTQDILALDTSVEAFVGQIIDLKKKKLQNALEIS